MFFRYGGREAGSDSRCKSAKTTLKRWFVAIYGEAELLIGHTSQQSLFSDQDLYSAEEQRDSPVYCDYTKHSSSRLEMLEISIDCRENKGTDKMSRV